MLLNKQYFIYIVLFIVVSASFHGIFAKWCFMEIYPSTYSDFYSMYNNTARKPSCYRFFFIQTIKFFTEKINSNYKNKIQSFLSKNNFLANTYSKAIIKKEAIIEYYCLYFLCFLCFFFASFFFYKICVNVTQNQISSFLAVCIFDLFLPFLETNSGHFYDFSELFFFSITIYLVMKGYWQILFLTSIIATLNKETFIPFLLCLLPFFKKYEKQKFLKTHINLMVICSISHIITILFFSKNISIAETHYAASASIFFLIFFIISLFFIIKKDKKLKNNLLVIVSMTTIILSNLKEIIRITKNVFMHFEMNYIPSGGRLFFIHLLLATYIIVSTYKYLITDWKEHFLYIASINLSLFFIFCVPYELRNFSMLYPCFIIMLANYFSKVVGIYCKEPINKKL